MTDSVWGFVSHPLSVVCPNHHVSPTLQVPHAGLIAHVEPCPRCGSAAVWIRPKPIKQVEPTK